MGMVCESRMKTGDDSIFMQAVTWLKSSEWGGYPWYEVEGDWEMFKFSIEGKMTDSMVAELKEAILPLIDSFQEIEIELSRVSEIDSAGLLLLMNAKHEAMVRNRKLQFTGHSRPVIKIAELCGMCDFIDVHAPVGRGSPRVEEAGGSPINRGVQRTVGWGSRWMY
jgi:anti-sigma B factor antagonist